MLAQWVSRIQANLLGYLPRFTFPSCRWVNTERYIHLSKVTQLRAQPYIAGQWEAFAGSWLHAIQTP